MQRIETGAPALVGKGRIGDHVVEGLEPGIISMLSLTVPGLGEFGIGQRIALHDQRSRIVMQDHVHPRQAARCGVFFLPVQRDGAAGLVADLQEE